MRNTIPFAAALALMLPAAGMAQQPQTQQQGQTEREADGKPVAPEITVQQPTPDVIVRQPAPDIAIEQAKPEVDLQQGRAQIEINRGEPQVDIQQPQTPVQPQIDRAQPNVEIRQARPIINIVQEKPEIVVERVQERSKVSIQRTNREQADLQEAGIQRREDLIGMDVVDREDDEVGSISDLILRDGRIETVIVTREGGLLGNQEQMVAIPWNQTQVDRENKRIRVQMSEDQIEDMAAFTYDQQARQQALVGPQEQQ